MPVDSETATTVLVRETAVKDGKESVVLARRNLHGAAVSTVWRLFEPGVEPKLRIHVVDPGDVCDHAWVVGTRPECGDEDRRLATYVTTSGVPNALAGECAPYFNGVLVVLIRLRETR
jgi:hypothetical protein